MTIQTINPATEALIKTYPLADLNQINTQIEAAHLAFQQWKKTSFAARSNAMKKIANLLQEKKTVFAELMANEMGKPLSQGKAEIEKCAWVCEHYAAHAEAYLAPQITPIDNKKAKVCYQPLGTIFAIMPWNFPFWQVFRFAAPTLMAGNTAILKHAPISTGTGETIAALFQEAGFPDNVFQHFILDNDRAAAVIAHEKISAVTLTGSGRAGSAVAGNAAKHLKKAVLELGGSDPYVVLADADLDRAAEAIVHSRMNNTGQVCIAAKRVIAVKAIETALFEKIKQRLAGYRLGNPLDPDTTLGPMARKDLRETVHQQVLTSIAQGAQLAAGGEIPKQRGFYYPPTLLRNVCPGMVAFDEEIFGPVIALIQADNEEHAIRLANQSIYGLGGAIFTQDLAKGERIATEEIEVGCCFVNSYVASDPRLPFGGIKQSGFGRELAREGILEFVNTKTILVNT